MNPAITNNVFIHQRGPAAHTYRVCVSENLIPYNTHGVHQCGALRGCLYCSECCISFCENPENANGRDGLRYEKLHSHNAISAPIYPMDADHFSRSGRNSAYNPHALLVMLFCTSCLSADFKCRLTFAEITSNVLRLSLCYRNVKR